MTDYGTRFRMELLDDKSTHYGWYLVWFVTIYYAVMQLLIAIGE